MRNDQSIMDRLQALWSGILALKNPQYVGPDSLIIYNNQTNNEWDIPSAVMSDANTDSQWTVTFTPDDISKPVYCEFEHNYQIISGGTAFDSPSYVWDDPATTDSNIKRFIIWRQNYVWNSQTIRMKFGVRATQPGSLAWTRNR